MTIIDDAYKDARECLQDVVSHTSAFDGAFNKAKQLLHFEKEARDFGDGMIEDSDDEADDVSYYEHEQAVIARMNRQAANALRVLPAKLTGYMTVDQVADAAAEFTRQMVSRTVVLAALHSDALGVPAPFKDMDPIVHVELEGVETQIDPILVRYIKSLAQFLPVPRDTALTQVTIHGPDGSEVQAHWNTLSPGAVFSWKHTPTKLYKCEGMPYIYYGGDEPVWAVKCDPINTEVNDGTVPA